MTHPMLLAMGTTEELLAELARRNVVVPCQSRMLVDGRSVMSLKKSCREETLEALKTNPNASIEETTANALNRFDTYMELRMLEVLSRGLATARPTDRVHQFTMEKAHGDYAPGSLMCTIDMLAIATNPAPMKPTVTQDEEAVPDDLSV